MGPLIASALVDPVMLAVLGGAAASAAIAWILSVISKRLRASERPRLSGLASAASGVMLLVATIHASVYLQGATEASAEDYSLALHTLQVRPASFPAFRTAMAGGRMSTAAYWRFAHGSGVIGRDDMRTVAATIVRDAPPPR